MARYADESGALSGIIQHIETLEDSWDEIIESYRNFFVASHRLGSSSDSRCKFPTRCKLNSTTPRQDMAIRITLKTILRLESENFESVS